MRGFAAIGPHRPKDPLNVGEVLRAAGCYGAAMIAASGTRYRRSRTDTQAAHRHLPLLECDDLRHMVPHGAVPVAVDLIDGAHPLPTYRHPVSAFYVFGPEDGTLGADILSWCRDVIYVPTRHCMNLAATVNVVLYDRAAKHADRHDPHGHGKE
jgi:tRNA(Leu) C34 or U34 (ribose-2'-O)-methylase TrmL